MQKKIITQLKWLIVCSQSFYAGHLFSEEIDPVVNLGTTIPGYVNTSGKIPEIVRTPTARAPFPPNGSLYTLGFRNADLYQVDVETGNYSAIAKFSAPLSVTPLSNGNTGYVTDSTFNNIYQVDLNGGANFPVKMSMPIPFPSGLAFTSSTQTEALVASAFSGDIYKINFDTGVVSLFGTGAGINANDVAVANANTAYVVSNSTIYSLDLTNPSPVAQPVLTILSHELSFIQLIDETRGYVASYDGNIYQVDLSSPTSILKATIPSGDINGFYIQGSTAFVVSYTNNEVGAIDLATGAYTFITTISGDHPGLTWLSFVVASKINTAGLTGNNLRFANYLNANAPKETRELFARLRDGLVDALERAAPTRNGFFTFASQNAYLTSSQVLNAHLRLSRFKDKNAQGSELAALVADCSDEYATCLGACCDVCPGFSIWAAPFGEYAREKSQHQTPAFDLEVGGVVSALDYNTISGHVFGFGGSYVRTNVREDHSFGRANLNQGYLAAYATWNLPVYIDLSVWGGYYRGVNHRHISFDGIDITAKAQIPGWQVASHIEVGYNPFYCTNRCFGMEPFIQANWVGNWEKGFQESNAGFLNMGQEGRFCSFLRGESGVRFSEIIHLACGGKLVFQEVASYVYQKAFHTGSITGFLVGSPGSFTVTTLTGAQNMGLISFSMLYVPAGPKFPYVEVRYQGQFGSRFQSHLGSVELGKTF